MLSQAEDIARSLAQARTEYLASVGRRLSNELKKDLMEQRASMISLVGGAEEEHPKSPQQATGENEGQAPRPSSAASTGQPITQNLLSVDALDVLFVISVGSPSQELCSALEEKQVELDCVLYLTTSTVAGLSDGTAAAPPPALSTFYNAINEAPPESPFANIIMDLLPGCMR